MPQDPPRWTVLVPVRGGGSGKSRLSRIEERHLTPAERVEVAMAMARDTVTAAVAAGVGPVVVVTADPQVTAMARSCGAAVREDRGRGLNSELSAAAAVVGPTMGVCALLGDLPALTAESLAAALEQAADAPEGGFVPDHEGTGTALVAVGPGAVDIGFRFGPGSARRHEEAGLSAVGTDLPRVRCDVDTTAAWEQALELGLGPATSALRAALLTGPAPGAPTEDR